MGFPFRDLKITFSALLPVRKVSQMISVVIMDTVPVATPHHPIVLLLKTKVVNTTIVTTAFHSKFCNRLLVFDFFCLSVCFSEIICFKSWKRNDSEKGHFGCGCTDFFLSPPTFSSARAVHWSSPMLPRPPPFPVSWLPIHHAAVEESILQEISRCSESGILAFFLHLLSIFNLHCVWCFVTWRLQ